MMIWLLLKRDLLLTYRNPQQVTHPLLFFAATTLLFPLAMRPDPHFLQILAPSIIWIAVILSCLIDLDHLFRVDYQDGTLNQLFIYQDSLFIWTVSKIILLWLTLLPLILMTPLIAIALNTEFKLLLLTLILGTPIICLLSALGAAFTLNSQQNGLLISLLVLPLCIPVLIFATSAVTHAESSFASLGWLCSLLFLALATIPWIITKIVTITIRY